MHSQQSRTRDQIQAADLSLKVLSCGQVQQIDDLLSEMGPFGELHLIVKKGRLRFIQKVESLDVFEQEHAP